VSLSKLGKKLRREAIANPKKAALLGLVIVLALYFWAPLIRGWIVGNKTTTEATTDTAAAAVPPAAGAPAATEKSLPVPPSWQKLVQWMHEDPRTMTAPMLTQTRDPFEMAKSDETKVEEPAEVKTPTITPTAAGLVLTSTIVGPQRRVVQINGDTYTVGQTIEVVKEKESLRAKFKVVEIHPRRAVLEAEGERFELTIPEPNKSGKIEFVGAASGK
jgi:hypothetical protein